METDQGYTKGFPSMSLFCTGLCDFFHRAQYHQYGLDKEMDQGLSLALWASVIKRLWERQVEGPSESDKRGERCPGRDGVGNKGRVEGSKLGGMDRVGRTDGHDQKPEHWRLIVIFEAVLGGDKAQGEPESGLLVGGCYGIPKFAFLELLDVGAAF